jgi:segregation and condensation protein B
METPQVESNDVTIDNTTEVMASIAEASSLRQVVGALVFSSSAPISAEAIKNSIRNQPMEPGESNPFAKITVKDVKDALEEIALDLHRLGLGMDLVEVADGWRYQTQAGCGKWVRTLLKADKPARLSKSALETLAIIAYRQPIARSEIEGIRGVAVDHVIRALTEMHLIRMTGRSDLPGKPFLYGTTPLFLEHFGLKNLDELEELDPTLRRPDTQPVQSELPIK